jgi:hypothetical protein
MVVEYSLIKRGGGRSATFFRANEPKRMGARSATKTTIYIIEDFNPRVLHCCQAPGRA